MQTGNRWLSAPTNNTAINNTTDNTNEINSNETDTDRDIVEVDDDEEDDTDSDSDNPFLPSEEGRDTGSYG